MPNIAVQYNECISVLQVCAHPPAPSPILGEGEQDQSPSPALGEEFRVRAAKVGAPQYNEVATQTCHLSDREQEVLALLIEGQSNIEIGAALHLSPSTIKTHIKSIMNKFGVQHRVQVAVFALRSGLI